jgi:hypothetical protein
VPDFCVARRRKDARVVEDGPSPRPDLLRKALESLLRGGELVCDVREGPERERVRERRRGFYGGD